MLILSRKIGEKIKIGEDIEILVVEILGMNQVKIGINAPKGVPILREEVYKRIQEENIKASSLPNNKDIFDKMDIIDKKTNFKTKRIAKLRRKNGD